MGGMFDTDALLRQMDHLAELVQAHRDVPADPTGIERQLDALTGMSLRDLATLPPHELVPPLDDPRRRRQQALGIADALHVLGYSREALRLVEVASTWRAEDEVEAERRASWGEPVQVWLGETMACVRLVPRSLSLGEPEEWTGDLAGWRGDAVAVCA